MSTIPNDWTACEAYRGHTIAIRNQWYAGFIGGIRVGGGDTRERARRAIDLQLAEIPDATLRAHEARSLGATA